MSDHRAVTRIEVRLYDPAFEAATQDVYTRATLWTMSWSTTADSPDDALQRDALHRVGIRELRNQVAAVIRRAAAGERIIITVDGHPAAQLGPLSPVGSPTIDDLVTAGLVRPPQRHDRPDAPDPVDPPIDARSGTVLDELRGG